VDVLIQLNPGVNPSALRIGQQICVPRSSLELADNVFRVSFIIPANWREVSPQRLEGPNGFLLLAAIGGPENIEEVCRNEAFHVLRPYGSNPTIQRLTAGGQEACLILPSADQPPGMNNQAALIVRYPAPVTINGQTYNYFVLYADQPHIRGFANTLEFLPII
jgi:TolB protein